MKRLITSIGLILAAAFVFAEAFETVGTTVEYYASISDVTAEEMSQIEELKQTKAAFTFGYLIERELEDAGLQDDAYAQFTAEFCLFLQDFFDIKITKMAYESREHLQTALENLEVDFAYDFVPGTDSFTDYYLSEPVAYRTQYLYTLDDRDEIMNESEVSGLKLGFLENSDNLNEILKRYPNLSFEAVTVSHISLAADMLASGTIDGFVTDMNLGAYFESDARIHSKKFFALAYSPITLLAVQNEFEPLISALNKYIESGGNEMLYRLYKDSENKSARRKFLKSLTDEEKAYIEDLTGRGEPVIMGCDHDNYPIDFYNTETKRFEGIAIDILDEITVLTGLEFKIKNDGDTPWVEINEDLINGDIAFVPHLSYSQERSEYSIWSDVPYAYNRYCLISRADLPNIDVYQISDLKVGVLKSSASEVYYREWFPDYDNLITYSTVNDSFDALEKGEIDLVMAGEYLLLAQVNFREKTEYKVNYYFYEGMDVLFGFNKSEAILCSIINKAQKFVDTDAISDYWNARVFDYNEKMSQLRLAYLSVFSCIISVILVLVVFQFIRNKKLSKNLLEHSSTLSAEREKLESTINNLRISQQSLQLVLDSLAIPIRILDAKTKKIVYVNASLLKLFEYDSAEELYGQEIYCMLPEIQSNGIKSSDIVEKTTTGTGAESSSAEVEYCTKSGRIIEALVVTCLIDYKGVPSSIGIIKDLTAEKKQAEIMRNAAKREKEANQLKSMFLANMSHEIRTPMNGILGMAELMLGESISGRQLQYVKDIKTSAQSLLGIINDILDLSKIEEGKLKISKTSVDLSMMLKNVVSMMSFSARSKGLGFLEDIRINSPEYVQTDDVRLSQIIINLLSNAVKFTANGHVMFMAEIKDEAMIFEISDTGIGIQQEDLSLIFSAFEQVDKNRNRAIKGTGLGLSIAKSLVELMGGTIVVKSQYGSGTTFTVTLPYIKGDESAIEPVQAEFSYISAPSAKALLVDDIQTNLTVGAGLLRLCDITADVALSGKEAIELVKAKDYDIIFMDHMMPEMDGVEALNLIRGLGGKCEKLPIIALTANAVNESRDMLISAGMDDFLSKPIDKALLVGILQKWLPPEKINIKEGIVKNTETKYSPVLAEAAKINGLDIGLALSRLNGLTDVLETSLKQTAYSIDKHLKAMDVHLAAEDLHGFAIEAHGMKGTFANIGAARHSGLAAELEIAAKADNIQLCQSKFPVFADVIETFAIELKSVFPIEEDADKPIGDYSLLRKKAREAISLFNDFESADALACLAEVEEFSFGEELNELLRETKIAAEAFSYEKAIELLEEIIRKGNI